jgi:hypothetical protein
MGWNRGLELWFLVNGWSPTTRLKSLSFQHWHLVVAFALLPALWLSQHIWRRRIRHSRIKNGLCLICGYDLRASKDRCPECGTAISQ